MGYRFTRCCVAHSIKDLKDELKFILFAWIVQCTYAKVHSVPKIPPYYLSNTKVKTEQILVLFWISTNLLSKGMQAVKLCTNKVLLQKVLRSDWLGTHTHTHTRLTALCLGLPKWAGTRKVKPICILLKQETVNGSGISWTICKSLNLTPDRQPHQHLITQFFTGRMPFLPPNQQHQSTEGRIRLIITRAVRHLAMTRFGNDRWHRLPSCLISKYGM